MSCAPTTISCRAFALCAALLVCAPARSGAADKPVPPRLPLTAFWSVDLGGAASAPPLNDGDRVYVALKSAHLTARAVTDGHELWRITKDVTVPMAAEDGLVFVSAGDAIEAVRGKDGVSAWIVPHVKAVAPLVARAGWVIAVTDAEIVAIRGKDGQVAWRHPAGGVRLPPDVDGDRVYAGANDGRVLALTLSSGDMAWEAYVPLGVSTIAAYAGRVYAGAGDNHLYALNGRTHAKQWGRDLGSIPTGRIAVDDDRVYVAALNNVVYALDRENGNQRWKTPLRRRPSAGVVVVGHVVFVASVAPGLTMLYDRDGRPSGTLPLPADIPRDVEPHVRETAAGVTAVVVTGGLSNEWRLTYFAPVDDASLTPLSELTAMPGVPYLTDPVLLPIGRVLGVLILGDPVLRPASELEWPVVLRDPPLEPLTVIPGLQLRPLSPVLPTRSGG